MKKIYYLFFIFINCTNFSTAQEWDRQSNINSIFDKIEHQGVDTKKTLLYGFFFYDKDSSKLVILKDELLKDNYNLVRLEMTEKHEFILHVEKMEIHTRASLLERENHLDKLSKKNQIATYDGWDVGNVDSSRPLISKDSFDKSLDGKSDKELYKIATDLYDDETNDKAIIAFQKLIERNYKTDICYYKLGVSFIGVGQTTIGIQKLEEALRINPKYFKACFNIGATCYDNKEFEKSIEYYQKAAKLEPNDDQVYFGIAASQFALGQLIDSEMNCKISLKINPSSLNAKVLLDKIKKN